MKMVEDVLLQWEEMEGATWRHRQVNAVLTALFIDFHNVPADECHSEAVVVLGLQGIVAAGEWERRVLWFLKERFAAGRDDKGKPVTFPEMEPACEAAARMVDALCESLGPVNLDDLFNAFWKG